MTIFHGAIYIVLLAFLNHVRGGYLQKFYHFTLLWKALAALLVGLDSWLVLGLGPVYGMALGGLWWAFMMPPWATWFDMGMLPVEFRKQQNNYLLNYPYELVERYIASPRLQDQIMMTLRGLASIVIFGPIAYVRHEPLLALLTLPCAVLWMAGYDIDRNYIQKNWSEYLSGAVIGAFIVLAVIL
jgi:hypothetical protein